jgi:hypothetical protein
MAVNEPPPTFHDTAHMTILHTSVSTPARRPSVPPCPRANSPPILPSSLCMYFVSAPPLGKSPHPSFLLRRPQAHHHALLLLPLPLPPRPPPPSHQNPSPPFPLRRPPRSRRPDGPRHHLLPLAQPSRVQVPRSHKCRARVLPPLPAGTRLPHPFPRLLPPPPHGITRHTQPRRVRPLPRPFPFLPVSPSPPSNLLLFSSISAVIRIVVRTWVVSWGRCSSAPPPRLPPPRPDRAPPPPLAHEATAPPALKRLTTKPTAPRRAISGR